MRRVFLLLANAAVSADARQASRLELKPAEVAASARMGLLTLRVVRVGR